jgi:DNA mismatch repair ATPase MutS
MTTCAAPRAGDLRRAPDMPRALTRLAMDRGGPRDLAAIREGIARAADAIAALLPVMRRATCSMRPRPCALDPASVAAA